MCAHGVVLIDQGVGHGRGTTGLDVLLRVLHPDRDAPFASDLNQAVNVGDAIILQRLVDLSRAVRDPGTTGEVVDRATGQGHVLTTLLGLRPHRVQGQLRRLRNRQPVVLHQFIVDLGDLEVHAPGAQGSTSLVAVVRNEDVVVQVTALAVLVRHHDARTVRCQA